MLSSQLPAVHRGVLFENQALHVLQKYFSMSLHRVGGKDDGGVDLRGWWWLPPLSSLSKYSNTTTPPAASADTENSQSLSRSRIRVIAQCKAEKKKMGPGYVREMEGVLHRHLHIPGPSTRPSPMENGKENGGKPPELSDVSMRSHPTVALIVSASPFTKASVLRAFSSTLPFLLLHLPFSESRVIGSESSLNTMLHEMTGTEQLGSAFWNAPLASGVLGDELELRWERFGNEAVQDHTPNAHGRPGLWWNNEPLQNWVPPDF